MKKSIKRIIATFLVVLMLLTSVPVSQLAGVDLSEFSLKAKAVDYSNLTIDQYLSKILLNYRYSGVLGSEANGIYNTLINYTPTVKKSRTQRSDLKKDKKIGSCQVIYDALTGKLLSKMDLSDIYAGVLIDMIGTTINDPAVMDSINLSAEKDIFDIENSLLDAAQSGIEVATVIKKFKGKAKLTKAEKKQLAELLEDNPVYSGLGEASNITSKYLSVIETATTYLEVRDFVCKVKSVGALSSELENTLLSIRNNTTDNDLKKAVTKVTTYITSSIEKAVAKQALSTLIKDGVATLVEKGFEKVITAAAGGPIATAISIGISLGDTISSALFSTNAVYDKLLVCYAADSIEEALVKATKSFASTYKVKESAQNAANFMTSLRCLADLYVLDTTYMEDMFRTLYTKGFVTAFIHKKEYLPFANTLHNCINDQKKYRTFLSIDLYRGALKYDAPSAFNRITSVSYSSSYSGGSITTSDIKRVCDAYNYVTNRYWTYPSGGSATSGFVSSTRKGRGYSYKYNGVECYGFANFIMSKVTGTTVNPNNGNKYGWTKLSPSQVTDLRVGDIVRIGKDNSNGHTGLVYTVNGSKCTFVQCLGGVDNKITVGNALAGTKALNNNYKNYSTLSSMKNDKALVYVYRYTAAYSSKSVTPVVNTHYTGSARFNPGTYIVTAKEGLKVRQKPTATSTQVGSLKYNASVEIKATDGNWGYTGKGWICLDYARYILGSSGKYSTANYNIGTYKVSAKDGLKVRTGPNTGYSQIRTLIYNTEFDIAEVDGSWGYSEALKGWLCLDYAKFVRNPVPPPLPVPGTPGVATVSPSEIGVGDIITVNWSLLENTDSYTAELIDAGKKAVVETKSGLTTGEVSFVAPYAGTFDVSVVAKNSQQTSHAGYINGITAKAPVKVTFKDWNDAVIETVEVKYGQDAKLPAAPTRTGYTFSSWDGEATNITADTVIKAVYTKNSYSVKFYDYDGTLLNTQSVLFEDSAKAPSYSAPAGYSFVAWDTDFSKITEDTDVKAILQWASTYPLEISTKSNIYRNGKTYITTAIVNNSPNSVSDARVIVSLKTKENKELAQVASGSISLAAGEVKNVTLSVDYDKGAATVGDIFVVRADSDYIPLANKLTVKVDQGTAWSQWSTAQPPTTAIETQSRTEYRKRTKSFDTRATTSETAPDLGADWILYNTTSAYTDWSGFSAWQDTYVAATDLVQVKTQTVQDTKSFTSWSDWSGWSTTSQTKSDLKDVETKKQYNYSRYKNSAGTWAGPTKGTWNGYSCTVYQEKGWSDSALTYVRTDSSNQAGTFNVYKASGDSIHWYNETTRTMYRYRTRSYGTKTQYSYSTRSLNYTYYYYKWSDWSGWTTDSASSDSNTDVQTRTTYRYISNTPENVEDKSGIQRTISGSIGAQFANKYAIVRVVDSTGDIQFIGQTKITADGKYSYSFKLKDEPTANSGDYKVLLSIEGATSAIELEPISAPVPRYTVTFKNFDGKVIKTESVKKGENATSPAVPERTGYTFTGWDKTPSNVQTDIVVTAQYEKETYDIIFVDEINNTTETIQFSYGDKLTVPEIESIPDSYNFKGWDAVINGKNTVTSSMVIKAVYEIKSFNVTVYGYNNEVLGRYAVEYGDGIDELSLPEDEIHNFIGWDSPTDLNYVTCDASVYPVYDYKETVAPVTANISDASYSSDQMVTLSCATQGAQIYYTLDGTDPLAAPAAKSAARNMSMAKAAYPGTLYTGPIKVSSSSELVYVAVKDNMNSSMYDETVIAVNSSASAKKYVVTIHNDASGNDYSYITSSGSKIDLTGFEAETCLKFEGLYKDAGFKSAWNTEKDLVTGDTELYAKWSSPAYTVIFKDDSGNDLSKQTVKCFESASAPEAPSLDGHTFAGWTEDFDYVTSDLVVEPVYCPTEDFMILSISMNELILGYTAKTQKLSAEVKLGNEAVDDYIHWISSDEKVVTVNEEGLVASVGDGTAVITAVSDEYNLSAQCSVTVSSQCLHKLSVSTTEATCTTEGIEITRCTICGETVKVETIKATGHIDKNNDGNCDKCGTKISGGNQSASCSCNCHKTGFMALIWKIQRFFWRIFSPKKQICGCGVKHW